MFSNYQVLTRTSPPTIVLFNTHTHTHTHIRTHTHTHIRTHIHTYYMCQVQDLVRRMQLDALQQVQEAVKLLDELKVEESTAEYVPVFYQGYAICDDSYPWWREGKMQHEERGSSPRFFFFGNYSL
jgi:hypothetical protein